MSLPLPPPRKRLGQHFLIDPNIVRKIVALAALQKDETVLEIGPGRGILTKALCDAARSVIGIELDQQLGRYLRETMGPYENFDLRIGDALEFPYDQVPVGTVVVANLPYYVSTPLLFRLFQERSRIDRMVLMLQTEVARRLVARPGTKDYGILSVLTQFATTASLAFQVPINCFRPRPEVGSSVVSLVVRKQPPEEVKNEALFIRTVRAAFAHRRKTLANSLRDEGFPPDAITRALADSGIVPSRRAETLGLHELAVLSSHL